jgi:hypothetical protein
MIEQVSQEKAHFDRPGSICRGLSAAGQVAKQPTVQKRHEGREDEVSKRRAVERGLRIRTVDGESRPSYVIGGDEDDGFPGSPCW